MPNNARQPGRKDQRLSYEANTVGRNNGGRSRREVAGGGGEQRRNGSEKHCDRLIAVHMAPSLSVVPFGRSLPGSALVSAREMAQV